jgi:hypothetical protein
MKFRDGTDKELLLQELREDSGIDISNIDPIDEKQFEAFIQRTDVKKYIVGRRKNLLKRLKDFRKSQIQKHNWRAGRYKYLKGIRQFSRSVEGKRFHRNLARFMVSRGVLSQSPAKKAEYGTSSRLREDQNYLEIGNTTLSRFDSSQFLVLLTALTNRLVLETQYYLQPSEEADYLVMLETVLPELSDLCQRVEQAIIDYEDFQLREEDVYLIDSLLDDKYDYAVLASASDIEDTDY